MQKYIQQFYLSYAILGLFTGNNSRFLIKFIKNANQIKTKYSLEYFVYPRWCNKDVIIYFGASVLEFVRAIRSLLRICNFAVFQLNLNTSDCIVKNGRNPKGTLLGSVAFPVQYLYPSIRTLTLNDNSHKSRNYVKPTVLSLW